MSCHVLSVYWLSKYWHILFLTILQSLPSTGFVLRICSTFPFWYCNAAGATSPAASIVLLCGIHSKEELISGWSWTFINFRFNLTFKILCCNSLCSPAGKLFVSPLNSLSSFLCLPCRTSGCTSWCLTNSSSSSTTCRASRAGSKVPRSLSGSPRSTWRTRILRRRLWRSSPGHWWCWWGHGG